ncbi:MAG TPA: hypothetical protein VGN56_01545 [Candidatus Paceibacterota bacterium]|jgi:hypothetical protein|nr:hypothetical protein [Candidatus Paceibacterota bacterium]
MNEMPPRSSGSKEAAPKPEEDLLAHFRSACETETSPETSHDYKIRTYHSLHEDLDNLEEAPMIGQYEQGMIPTIQSLIEAAQVASLALESDPDDAEALRIGKLIRGQASSIRTWCRRYVSSIIKFHTMKRQMLRMNDEEKRNSFQAADAERRRVHESLLDCLKTFNTLLTEGLEHAEYAAPRAWQPGTLLPNGTSAHEAVIFGPKAIQDRDLMKSWAIAADCVEEMRKIIGADDFPPSEE